jgi:uncharacterized repeat protein (TIGR01451 family)
MRRATDQRIFVRIAVLTLMFAASAAIAQDKGCIELQTVAETEQQYVDVQGNKATRLVTAGKIVPGDQVVWTITAKNICDAPAQNVVIANPVPEHMSYVAGSAMGVGTQTTYSIDGKQFLAADAIKVNEANGTSRPARPDEYRAIRWTYVAPFPKGATAFVRYRATVN